MVRLRVWWAVLLLAVPVPARVVGAQAPAPTPGVTLPDQCSLSPVGEAAGVYLDRLQEVMDRVLEREPGGPGVAALLVQGGGVVAQRRYGMASLEHGVPFTPNHVVRLPYSEGREFIAVAAALMESDGLIDLDHGVRRYFPQLPGWSEPVTLQDLIHHRSGFVDEWSVLLLMHGSMANRLEESQFLRLLQDQPGPEVEPGDGYMYSNSDYGLLRLILEEAADGLGEYMERRLFHPLGMHSTRLVEDFAEVVPHHAPFYAPGPEGPRHADLKTSPGGDYVVATTACDLVRWAQAHMDPASEISRAVERLREGGEPVPGREGHYAFGLTFTEASGTPVVRHEGVLEVTYLTRIPSLDFSVITFGNRYYEPAESQAIVDFLLDPVAVERRVRFPTERVPVDSAELVRYTGAFVSRGVPSWESRTEARDLIRVEARGGTLVLDWAQWGRFELVPVGEGVFSWHDGPTEESWGMLVEFGGTDGGGPGELVIRYNDGYPSETFVRLEPWRPSPELLRRLAGTYHSPHLDYSWTVRLDDAGDLILRAPTLAEVRLEPWQPGEFLLRLEKFPGVPFHVWVQFHPEVLGVPTHLTVWNPRLMHHRFDRR